MPQIEEKTKKIVTGVKRKHPIKNDKKAGLKSPQRKVQKTHEPSEGNLHKLSPSPERTDVIIDNNENDNEKAEASNKKISLNEHNSLSSTQHNATENISISDVDAERIIMDLFLVKMPKDFFQFYEFCKSISKNDPLSACKSVRLKLVGPYDVLDGKIKIPSSEDNKEEYLTHWRYYYDPPEFQV